MLDYDPKGFQDALERVQERLGVEYLSLSDREITVLIQLDYLSNLLVTGFLEIQKKKEKTKE
jgi:hypothetical protein